jgi:hypothetical protein
MDLVLFEKGSTQMSLVGMFLQPITTLVKTFEVLNNWNLLPLVNFLIVLQQLAHNFVKNWFGLFALRIRDIFFFYFWFLVLRL